MARIPEDTVERIAAASDIVDIIGSHMQLKRAGSSWKGLCPFHHEKTPSFHVNPARQTYKCFGCGAGGGVFRFVMDYEHVDFQTAVRRLASRANIPVEEESPEDRHRRGERDRLLALHRDAAAWFHENLMRRKIAAHAREYLKQRGIGSEIAVRWQLGYAPDSWDALGGVLRDRGYTPAEIAKSGLVTRKEGRSGDGKSGSFYDRFRNRLMFPISSDYGDVIAFSGRTLGDDPAKYVNSPETPLFTKGRVLFGLDRTKRAIIDANEAVVCEGQLDLIAAYEAGIRNVTAPQGTAFTPDQARMLKRLAESVVLCFDSDDAGRKAVERSLPALLSCGMNVRVARVPAGEDPDSLVRKHGADALRGVVDAAKDYFDNTLDERLSSGISPQRRAALARQLAGYVKTIADPALRETVAQRVRVRLELTEAAFGALLKSAPRPDVDREPEVPEVPEQSEVELPESARLLCRLAILSPEAREWMRARPERPSEVFGSGFALLEALLESDAAIENPPALAAFSATLSPAQERALAGICLGRPPENPVAVAQEGWKGLIRGRIRAQITALQTRMRLPETGMAEAAELHKQILDLQKRLGEV